MWKLSALNVAKNSGSLTVSYIWRYVYIYNGISHLEWIVFSHLAVVYESQGIACYTGDNTTHDPLMSWDCTCNCDSEIKKDRLSPHTFSSKGRFILWNKNYEQSPLINIGWTNNINLTVPCIWLNIVRL
jgi:hypothetical protein